MARKRDDRALALFERALDANPHPDTWRALASFHAQRRDFKNAYKALHAALDLRPGDDDILAELADLKELWWQDATSD